MRSPAWNPQYHQYILALNPIAYWLLDEKQGTVAYDWAVAHGQAASRSGTHINTVLAQPGVGDGRTSTQFDGINSYVAVHTPSLQAVFNGLLGSLAGLVRVTNAGVWTDGASRVAFQMRADGNNYTNVRKSTVNNQIDWLYRANGAWSIRSVGGQTSVDWMHWGITWNQAANRMRAYLDGVQQGADVAIGGVWVGALAANATLIGASFNTPLEPWSGYEEHVYVWNRELSAGEMLDMARRKW